MYNDDMIRFFWRHVMFFQYNGNEIREIPSEKINDELTTAGYIRVDELEKLAERFGFDPNTVEACRNTNKFFRSGVEVHKDYTFTELRILNGDTEDEDFVALYIRKNLLLIVDIEDADGSTKEKFVATAKRYPPSGVCCEKLIYAFIDSLLAGDHSALETIGNELSDAEDRLTEKDVDADFNVSMLEIKKKLSLRHIYYEQLLDITDAVCENDNDIFENDNLIYIENVMKKISRLREDTAGLKSTVEHLQDAYSSYLDIKMNNTMKIFTILTSIFFPLTIIVGWYGMNFRYMPELSWKYGYVFVILLSAVTVLVLFFIGKKKKWF